MNENNYCIYCHRNKINGKCYYGKTEEKYLSDGKTLKRWGYNGKKYLRLNKNGFYNQPKFARAIKKYGWDNFEHEILFNNLSEEQAFELEKTMIKITESYTDGYNNTLGGKGCSMTEEIKQKISNSLMGHPGANKGGHLTEEHKQKLRKPKPPMTKEHCEKIRKANIGKHNGINTEFESLAVIHIETGMYCKSAFDAERYGKTIGLIGAGRRHICELVNGKKGFSCGKNDKGEPQHWRKATDEEKRLAKIGQINVFIRVI